MQLDTFSEDKCLAKASVVKMPPPAGSEATPPATSSTSATTSTTFSCNVSLPPKLHLQFGNLSKEWKQWRQIGDAYEEVACHNVLNSFVHASIIYAVLYVIDYSVKC